MVKQMTILTKGLVLISVPLLFQLLFIGLVSKMRKEGADAEGWTIHTKVVMAVTESCRTHLLSAHSAIQGAIITRDPAFLAVLPDRERLAMARVAELKHEVEDNADQTRAVMLIEARTSRFLEFISEGARMVEAGKMDAEAASNRRRSAEANIRLIDAEFDRFVKEEQKLDLVRHGKLERSWRWLDGLLVWGCAVSVLGTVVVATLFGRNISGRITSLTRNAQRLAHGEELTPPIAGRDEIAKLDQVFHEMAETLSEAARRDRRHTELLERRAEELDLVNGQLREKATENEMFVYSVSHDLRSPLVNLQGFSKELSLIAGDLRKLLDRDDVPSDVRSKSRGMIDTDIAESVGFIQSGVSRLSAIIDALLRLSRAGRVEYRRVEVTVDPIVARVVQALRGTIDQRGATVIVGPMPNVVADPTAVEQVFANLIGNAVNYLDPKRPGRIEVFAADTSAGFGQAPGGCVIFAVEDNGLGIAESYKGKVFAAFQRLHGDVAKGEGIGLTLVRRMVERLGGKVWFESVVNQGTTFYVALPAVGAEPEPVEANGTMVAADSNSKGGND